MSKMVIFNCPAFDEGDCTSPTEHIPYATACEHIEDCKMKQIVELCEQYKKDYNITNGIWLLANNITNLLDIQEVK